VHESLLPGDGRERAVAVGLLGELGLDEQVGNRDVGPGVRERQRIRSPEPSLPARHERNPTGEIDLDRHKRTLDVRAAPDRAGAG
jgi:hypothetical protein